MNIFKILTIIANLGLFFFLVYVASRGDISDGEDWLIFISFILFLIFNLYFIIASQKGNGWLSLWFKRKSLEEKKKY